MSDVFHTNRRDGPWLITILAVADRRHGNIGYGLSFFMFLAFWANMGWIRRQNWMHMANCSKFGIRNEWLAV